MARSFTVTLKGSEPRSWNLETLSKDDATTVVAFVELAFNPIMDSTFKNDAGKTVHSLHEMAVTVMKRLDEGMAARLSTESAEFELTDPLFSVGSISLQRPTQQFRLDPPGPQPRSLVMPLEPS